VGGDVANMAEKRSTYKFRIGKSEGWRPLNLKVCNKVEWEGVDWICLAWDRDKW